MEWLSNMFVLTLPVIEKVVRPIIVYIFLIIGLRLAGKRELAQLNPIDLVVLLMLANTVQNAIIGNDTSITGGLIGAAALLAVNALSCVSSTATASWTKWLKARRNFSSAAGA